MVTWANISLCKMLQFTFSSTFHVLLYLSFVVVSANYIIDKLSNREWNTNPGVLSTPSESFAAIQLSLQPRRIYLFDIDPSVIISTINPNSPICTYMVSSQKLNGLSKCPNHLQRCAYKSIHWN